ncbi:hypothetical protein C9374_002317 [Naegleria lovaniensis]|uniref:DUF7932 domain-containing protein n=1 Tax=Naegleria lovaniensis TaxID=51637 RepID=A0AA88KLE1_NAELO|nr:uncharacterized protein C9374_002317 [Naegleria lovaniensis]KAG2386573.1 hypothetical protein C9374_002317 [Naegleria lovaniensis]
MDLRVVIDKSGRKGQDGPCGENGMAGSCGTNGIQGINGNYGGNDGTLGGNGGHGSHATNGTKGLHGENGSHGSDIHIVLDYFSPTHMTLCDVNNLNFQNNQIVPMKDGSVVLISRGGDGGKGGDGGDGGKGGDGGCGGQGGDGGPGLNGKPGEHGANGGRGGDGGNGGNAGDGGNGGCGGNGGNIIIDTRNPYLLKFVSASTEPGMGGKGGRGGEFGRPGFGGRPGNGGNGGMGGMAGPQLVYQAPPGHSQPKPPQLSNGQRGPNGNMGLAGYNGAPGRSGLHGVDGLDGHMGSVMFRVLDANNQILEQSSTCYSLKVKSFSLQVLREEQEEDDGVLEPGELVCFKNIILTNEGGLTLPVGTVITIPDHHSKEISFLSNHVSYILNVPLRPYEDFIIPDRVGFGGQISERKSAILVGDTFSSKLGIEICSELSGSKFEACCQKQNYQVQYPVCFELMSATGTIGKKELATVIVTIRNVSTVMAYGIQSGTDGSKRRVAIQMEFDPRLILHKNSEDSMTSQWISNGNSVFVEIPNIHPSDSFTQVFFVEMSDRIQYFEHATIKATLLLRNIPIEQHERAIRFTPTYYPPSAGENNFDLIFFTDSHLSRIEFLTYTQVFDGLSLSVNYWDIEKYHGVSYVDALPSHEKNSPLQRHSPASWVNDCHGKVLLYPLRQYTQMDEIISTSSSSQMDARMDARDIFKAVAGFDILPTTTSTLMGHPLSSTSTTTINISESLLTSSSMESRLDGSVAATATTTVDSTDHSELARTDFGGLIFIGNVDAVQFVQRLYQACPLKEIPEKDLSENLVVSSPTLEMFQKKYTEFHKKLLSQKPNGYFQLCSSDFSPKPKQGVFAKTLLGKGTYKEIPLSVTDPILAITTMSGDGTNFLSSDSQVNFNSTQFEAGSNMGRLVNAILCSLPISKLFSILKNPTQWLKALIVVTEIEGTRQSMRYVHALIWAIYFKLYHAVVFNENLHWLCNFILDEFEKNASTYKVHPERDVLCETIVMALADLERKIKWKQSLFSKSIEQKQVYDKFKASLENLIYQKVIVDTKTSTAIKKSVKKRIKHMDVNYFSFHIKWITRLMVNGGGLQFENERLLTDKSTKSTFSSKSEDDQSEYLWQ